MIHPSRLAFIAAALFGTAQGAVTNTCKILNNVALTFDDGTTENTGLLLQNLRELEVKATFHVTGQYLNDPIVVAYLRQIVEDGHTLGIRSSTSWDLGSMSDAEIRAGIKELQSGIQGVTGKRPKFIRFPYGEATDRLVALTNSMGMVATQPSLAIPDYEENITIEGVLDSVKRTTEGRNGADPVLAGYILSQHSVVLNSTLAVSPIVSYLKGIGYELVEMSECTQNPGQYITGGNGGSDNNDDTKDNGESSYANSLAYTTAAVFVTGLVGTVLSMI